VNDIILHSGKKLTNVHDEADCFLPNCCIHNPSEHPLRDAPMDWWPQFRHMVRVCEHGYRHPDPDDLKFKLAHWDFVTVEAISSVHLMAEHCDGCCQAVNPTPEEP
jgi:hypothetical protein